MNEEVEGSHGDPGSDQNQRVLQVPSIDQMVRELKAAGWIPLTRTCWKAPAGSGFAGCFLGPYGAWKAMKRKESHDA